MLKHGLLGVNLLLLAIGSASEGGFYSYADWTAATPAGGTASGVITLPDLSTVGISFATTFPSGTPGPYSFAQTSSGINYWNPSTPYLSSEVENAPPTTDILALIGGTGLIYSVTFAEAVKDPIMPIVSLGRYNVPTSYDFDAPFTILSQATGYWGGTSTSLEQLAGDVLLGREGHGTIQFLGTFKTISWTVPTRENWHGFTFGIRPTAREPPSHEVPEPTSLVLMILGGIGISLLDGLRTRAACRG